MHRRYHRGLRAVGLGLAAIVAMAVLAGVFTPLIFRGPRLAWLVERLAPPMRGSLHLGGGAFSPATVFALAVGQSASVTLDDLLVRDPEGVEVLRAQRVTAAVEVHLHPPRLIVRDVHLIRGAWRLGTMKTHRGVGFIAAFAAPPRSGRRPASGQPGFPGGAAAEPAGVQIVGAHLDGLDAVFDFPGWGLELRDVDARGQLHAGTGPAGSAPFGFEVQGVDARQGGRLRILGGTGGQSPVVLPFTRARMARVGTTPEAPSDLRLDVTEALTGRSRLSGQAVFTHLFRIPGSPPGPPGIQMNAAWTHAGDGLTAVAASRGAKGLAVGGADANVRVSLDGPFNALTAALTVGGLDVSYGGRRWLDLGFDLRLSSRRPATARMRGLTFRAPGGGRASGLGDLRADAVVTIELAFDRLVTADYLPFPARPLLAGDLSGTVRAHAVLGGRQAAIDAIDLRLDRQRRGPVPGRIRLVGAGESARAAAGRGEEAVLVLSDLVVDHGTLRVRSLSGTAFGGRVSLAGSVALSSSRGAAPPGGAVGASPGASPVIVDLRASAVDLARALPGTGAGGRLSLDAHVQGAFDDLTARVRFPPGQTVRLAQTGTYELPAAVSVRVRGDELVVPAVRITRRGGGSIEARGQVVFDRSVDLALEVREHPLAALPGLAGAGVPITGVLGASLRVSGAPEAPQVRGRFDLGAVTVRGARLGDGSITLSPVGPGIAVIAGDLFGKIRIGGKAGRGPLLAVWVDLQEFPLDPFLAQVPLPMDLRGSASGRITVDVHPGRLATVDARLTDWALSYAVRGRPATTAAPPARARAVNLHSAGPVHLTVVDWGAKVVLHPTALRSPGSDFKVEGRLGGGRLEARVWGRLGSELGEPLFRPWPLDVQGALAVDLKAVGPVEAPAVHGTVEIAEPVRVRLTNIGLEARVPAGTLIFEGAGVRTDGLPVNIGGATLRVSGDAALDQQRGTAGPLHLSIDGTLDARALERVLPAVITRAQGQVAVHARLAGTVASPTFTGHIDPGPITLWLRGPERELHINGGQIVGHGREITIEGVTATAHGGTVTIGPPGNPGRITLAHLWPFDAEAVSVPIQARDVAVHTGPLQIDDADAQLTVWRRPGQGPLTVSGEVVLEKGRLVPGARAAPSPARPSAVGKRAAAKARSPLADIRLDLGVHSDGQHFVVDPGWLPDVHVGLKLHVGGTVGAPQISGDTRGRGVWSWLALSLYKMFN